MFEYNHLQPELQIQKPTDLSTENIMLNILRRFLKVIIPFSTRGDLLNQYRQIECLLASYQLLDGKLAIGPLRGWAISPDCLFALLRTISQYPNPTVVEFGSGQSTLAISSLLHKMGGKLITVEHNVEYFSQLHYQLLKMGTLETVVPLVNPLKDDPNFGTTYDIAALPEIKPDVVFVDGPPGKGRVRLAALIWAFQNLAPKGVIFLDDFMRESEKECVEELKRRFTGVVVQEIHTEKGLAKISNANSIFN